MKDNELSDWAISCALLYGSLSDDDLEEIGRAWEGVK